ncbi:MAG: hypothetical protein PHE56_16080, partial [Bacteroidales bacterium]|nr:hypothetical protein [Bacteroidales bacterium]
MATQKQIAAAKHAREIKEMKQKYARKWGLHGIGLGNLTKITKEEAFDIVKDGGAIALGFAAGKIGGAMLKKAIVKPGEEDGAKKWIE